MIVVVDGPSLSVNGLFGVVSIVGLVEEDATVSFGEMEEVIVELEFELKFDERVEPSREVFLLLDEDLSPFKFALGMVKRRGVDGGTVV